MSYIQSVRGLSLLLLSSGIGAAADMHTFSLGNTPLAFEPNYGQASANVSYLSRGHHFGVMLEPSGIVLVPHHRTSPAQPVVIRWPGGNTRPALHGSGLLLAKTNYLLSSDSSQQQTNIPNFAKVEYSEIYPGIDLILYGNQSQLEYDLVVSPGASLDRLRLTFSGAQALYLDTGGDLVIKTGAGEIHQHKPLIYQQLHGRRRVFAGGYLLSGKDTVQFRVDPAYDHAQPLVIDPVLSYSSYLGGTGDDQVSAITTDSQGNVYVAGSTSSSDFPVTPGAYQTVEPVFSGFVAKWNARLDTLIYSTYLNSVTPSAIAVDSSGNAYLTGEAIQTMPTTPGAYQPTSHSPTAFNVFALKLNSTGSSLLYSTFIGGSSSDYGKAIAIDKNGSAYIAGYTPSADFPVTAGVVQPQYAGGASDAFILKLNPSGTALVYSTFFGDIGYDAANAIAVDASGNAYVAGYIQFCPGPCLDDDAYVVKLDPLGAQLIYIVGLYGILTDIANGLIIDQNGNAYVTGTTGSNDFMITPNALQSVLSGYSDAFLAKIDVTGNLVYSSYFGGTGTTTGHGIALDNAGNVVIAGQTDGGLAVVNPVQQNFGGNNSDGFVLTANLNLSGPSGLLMSTYLGGSAQDSIFGLATAASGDILIAGSTVSLDFPLTANALQRKLVGAPAYDAFVSRISTSPCSFAVTPSTQGVPPVGGIVALSVATSPACSWTASSNSAWLTVSSGGSGTGSGSLTVSAGANGTINARSGSLTVGGQIVAVTQAAGAACSYALSPQTLSFTAAGGSGGVMVITLAGCQWAPTFTVPWIYSPVASATGPNTLPYTVMANPGFVRIGSIVVKGQTLTITQAAGPNAKLSKVGIFRNGSLWLEDADGNQLFSVPPDQLFYFGGLAGDIPITGDWNGDGRTKVGVYRSAFGVFVLDYNGDGLFDPAVDKVYNLGVGTMPGDIPVIGDWNGDGRAKVGLFRQGYFWILDSNGNGVFEGGVDKAFPFGGAPGDVPVVGDWTGTGTSKVGLFRAGFFWVLDTNGNGLFDPGIDDAFPFGGAPGDVPVVGDWNGDGRSKVGLFRAGYFWVLDANGNHLFDGTGPGQDLGFPFGGLSGDKPVVGKW